MPDATTTPVDPAAAPAIREEITSKTDALRAAIAHLTDRVELAVSEGQKTQHVVADLSDRMPVTTSRIVDRAIRDLLQQLEIGRKADREALAKQVGDALAQERVDRDAAIAAAEARSTARIEAVADRVTALDLRIGVALGERDSKGEELAEEVTKVTKLAKRTDDELRVFTRGRVGFGLASAAIALALKSDLTWGAVKAWAWSHGLVLATIVGLAVVAVVVEIVTRLRARKGQAS